MSAAEPGPAPRVVSEDESRGRGGARGRWSCVGPDPCGVPPPVFPLGGLAGRCRRPAGSKSCPRAPLAASAPLKASNEAIERNRKRTRYGSRPPVPASLRDPSWPDLVAIVERGARD